MATDVVRNLGPGISGSYTYESVGNAEDLYDLLVSLNPNRTKFLSAFGTAEPAISTSFEWFTERVRPPQDNAHMEYEEYTFKEIDSQEGLRNYIQHFQNSGFITDTQKLVKKAFRRGTSEFAAAVQKALSGQSDDIEMMIVKSAVARAENPGTVAPRSGGIPYFMQMNTLDATFNAGDNTVTLATVTAQNPIDLKTGDFVYFTSANMPGGLTANRCYYIRLTEDAGRLKNKFKLYFSLEDAIDPDTDNAIDVTSAGTDVKMIRRNVVSLAGARTFTLEDMNTVLEMIYRRGGNGNQAYMSLRNKREFSKLINAQMQANRDGDKMTQYSDAATVYESDFGTITAHAHHLYADNRIDILDMQYWDLKWLDKTHEVEGLAKTGTYDKYVIESKVGVQATCPQASGAIVDISIA